MTSGMQQTIIDDHTSLWFPALLHVLASTVHIACTCSASNISQGSRLLPSGYFHSPSLLQFGPGTMQQHGFARNLDWEISTSSADLQPDDKDPSVELILTDNDYTRSMWCSSGPLICLLCILSTCHTMRSFHASSRFM